MKVNIKNYPSFQLQSYNNWYRQPSSVFNDVVHEQIKNNYSIWDKFAKDNIYSNYETEYRVTALNNLLNNTLDEPEFKNRNEQITEIKSKVDSITQPSIRCKYEVVMDELSIESNIPNYLNIKNPSLYIIRDLNNFVLLDLYSLNLDPRYFGCFCELIVANGLINRLDLTIKIDYNKNPFITPEIYQELYNKICNRYLKIEAEIGYNKFDHKSEYHYFAFHSLINLINRDVNPLELVNGYLKLVSKLNESNIVKSLENYCRNIHNNSFINQTFGTKLSYQHPIYDIIKIIGYIDMYSNECNIIDIKTSSRDLTQMEYTNTMKTWFKQMNIYNHWLGALSKKYIAFNPLSNMVCIWG